MRRTRRRRAEGRLLLRVEVDEDAVPHALVALGVLDRAHLDDETEIARAAPRLLNKLPALPAVARNAAGL